MSKSLTTIIKQESKKQESKKQEPAKKQESSKIKSVSRRSKKEKDTTESDSIESTEYNTNNIKLNELIYPCKDETLYTKVILNPHQMNNDLYINLKKNLIDKIEGKCIKEGYIIKVYKILEYTNGIIDPENFTGSAIYNVKYLAKICVALKDTTIIANITQYIPNANFALVEFGNIIKIIFTKNKKDLNTNLFSISNDKNIIHLPTQNKLKINDHVKIQLKTIKFYQHDNCIKCMGYLDDIASKEDIEQFAYKNEIAIKDIISDTFETIYYNDDNETMAI